MYDLLLSVTTDEEKKNKTTNLKQSIDSTLKTAIFLE